MNRKALAYMMAVGSVVAFIGCDDDDDDNPAAPAAEIFRATLNGTSERPTPRTTPAAGTAELTFRRDTLYWTITMTGLTNMTMAHIHIGAVDVAGGIILGLAPPGTNTSISGFIARAAFTAPAAPNNALTFDGLLDLMRTGGSYVNVHTNDTANDPTNNAGPGDFPGGEIRGQIAKVT